jgi:hypothetical protein
VSGASSSQFAAVAGDEGGKGVSVSHLRQRTSARSARDRNGILWCFSFLFCVSCLVPSRLVQDVAGQLPDAPLPSLTHSLTHSHFLAPLPVSRSLRFLCGTSHREHGQGLARGLSVPHGLPGAVAEESAVQHRQQGQPAELPGPLRGEARRVRRGEARGVRCRGCAQGCGVAVVQ